MRAVEPDFAVLKGIRRMAIVTAPGDEQDVASRVFVPYAGIDEDPVTGSSHCALAPYWAQRLGRKKLRGFQASARGGIVEVELAGDRVLLRGSAVSVVRGQLAG